LQPYAIVGVDDEVAVSTKKTQVLLEGGQKKVDVSPAWRHDVSLTIGSRNWSLTIKEVETQAELEALHKLKGFHYRNPSSTGRMAPLIAVIDDPLLPPVIGFIEITSALLVNTARKKILDRPYVDKDLNIFWRRWTMDVAKENTRRIARISRCVVYPEIRGLGISKHLAEAAVKFARERWHYGGVKPIFMEITADMLRYIPFVKGSGFVFVGQTEGNEQRVLKDMKYLLKRTIKTKSEKNFPKGGGGIMDLQRSYAVTLQGLMKNRGMSLEVLLNMLRRNPSDFTDDEWIALHRVFRHPKPTYMIGLTSSAQKFLKSAAPLVGASANSESDAGRHIEMRRPSSTMLLSIKNLGVSALAVPSRSARARKVAEAFGVVSKDVGTTLIQNLSLTVARGEILLVTGPSGSGKSLLLKALCRLPEFGENALSEYPDIDLRFEEKSGSPRMAWLEAHRSDQSAVDLLGHLPLEDALSTLAAAGLGEAPLFVRPTRHFSDGQLYRLAVAVALSKKPDILIVDAFCEPLDYFSMATVCSRLRGFCRKHGIALIAATADASRSLDLLQPDRQLQLLPGRTHKLISL
jgi:ABC-type ATPase with predicted acetyltransferase domain